MQDEHSRKNSVASERDLERSETEGLSIADSLIDDDKPSEIIGLLLIPRLVLNESAYLAAKRKSVVECNVRGTKLRLSIV